MNSLERMRTIINGKFAERRLLREQVSELESRIAVLEQETEDLSTAKKILAAAVAITQKQVSRYIENLVTLALRSVFKTSDYHFIADYKNRKDGRAEVSLLVRDGDSEPYYPEDEQGGGVVDIISFVLRPILLSLQVRHARKVLLLDEPFRFTGDYTELAGQMLKEVSQKLGIQVIMITHARELMGVADRAWEVTREQGRSVVRRLDREGSKKGYPSLRPHLLKLKGSKGRKQREQITGKQDKEAD